MAVKVFIKRTVPKDLEEDLSRLLKKLRSETLGQPGYLSGQTFRRIDKLDEWMVIGTWLSADDWYSWFNNEKRVAIQSEIDLLLGSKTEYGVYE